MSRKIGFWAVFAIVTGSQIGSGVFMLPATLAPYGFYGLMGWVFSGLGALALSIVFSKLCMRFPHTGGPHVYVEKSLGKSAAFFTGWTYWVISWVSTPAVIVTTAGYLSPVLGLEGKFSYLAVELVLLFSIIAINLRGVNVAGKAEFVLTFFKFIPLIILPLLALAHFDIKNIAIAPEMASLPVSKLLAQTTLLTLWGFIGLETATVPAGSVDTPTKTIPRAIILGTLSVVILYLINSLGMMGAIPSTTLAVSKAPYIDVAQHIFGGNWHFVISIIAAVACIGTLNAWVLTSGQIALGLSQDGFLPKFFGKVNKQNAPHISILISNICIVPILILTLSDNLAAQVAFVIDVSVLSFIFVYLVCCCGFLVLKIHHRGSISFQSLIVGLIAALFCLWILFESNMTTLMLALSFSLCGLPLYAFWYVRKNKKQ